MPPRLLAASLFGVVLLSSPVTLADTSDRYVECVQAFRASVPDGPYRVEVRVGGLDAEPSIVEAAEHARAEGKLDLLIWIDPPGAHAEGRLHLASATLPIDRERALVRGAQTATSFDEAACQLLDTAGTRIRRARASRAALVALAISGLVGFLAIRGRVRAAGAASAEV